MHSQAGLVKSAAVQRRRQGARGCVDVRLRRDCVDVRLRRVGPATTAPRTNDGTSRHIQRSAEHHHTVTQVTAAGSARWTGGSVETSLRTRVRAGDPDAFGQLFDECASVVYRHAVRLTGDWGRAARQAANRRHSGGRPSQSRR
ncbi:hypothetical protein ACFY1A_21415 [Streptomyces sp. NPDC001520]|uniref:hypothetical protein n=1 Tax=Streptomyces sp. NPDC001520 TaxID=3364581 RepID=UPI003693507A